MARPSMRSCRMRWATDATVIPVGADGLIDEAALDAVLADGPGAGRDPAGQQRDRRDPAARPASRREVREAGSLLLADCAQSAGKLPLPDADFIAMSRAQARRAAGDRRPAGPATSRRSSRSAGRRRAIAAARRMCRARWPSPRRSPRGPTTWTAPGAASRARSTTAFGSRRGGDRRRQRRGSPTIGAIAHARRIERRAARPVRPRRDRGVGRKRLLVGKHEGEPGARGDGRPAGHRRRLPPGQLRARHERGRRRRLPRRMAAHRERAASRAA